MMCQQYLTSIFDPKRSVLQERKTSFFWHLLIYGPTTHKLSGPGKVLHSVHFLWVQIHPFYRNPDIRPVFQKTRPFAADLRQLGEKHVFLRVFQKN